MKQSYLIPIFFILFVSSGRTQELLPPPEAVLPVPPDTMFRSNITFICPPEPEFPGGYQALMQYCEEHLVYDSLDVPNCMAATGIVYVQFTVCASGKIDDVKIRRGYNPTTDAYCIRFIQGMPDWIPAMDHTNTPIDTVITFPIRFE